MRNKLLFFKLLFIIIFMFFVFYKTVNYLYDKKNITEEEYIKLLLSDSYKENDNNFYKNIIKLFNKNISPIKMLEIPSNNVITRTDEYNYNELLSITNPLNNPNKELVDKPVIYIYNTHSLENYELSDYNITPNVMMVSYILQDKFNKLNIPTIIGITNSYENYFEESRKKILQDKKDYSSIKYFIDIHRSNEEKNITTIKINDVIYSRILFILGSDNKNNKENYEFMIRLSSRLNELYPGISRGITKTTGTYNQDIDSNLIVIEFGGIENNMNELLNTIDAFAVAFKSYIGE